MLSSAKIEQWKVQETLQMQHTDLCADMCSRDSPASPPLLHLLGPLVRPRAAAPDFAQMQPAFVTSHTCCTVILPQTITHSYDARNPNNPLKSLNPKSQSTNTHLAMAEGHSILDARTTGQNALCLGTCYC